MSHFPSICLIYIYYVLWSSFILSLLYKTVSELFVIDNYLLPAYDDVKPKSEKDRLKEILPALCRADDPEPKVCRFTTGSVICK